MAGLAALGTIFIPGLAEVKDLPQAANMALKLIAKGGFEKPWLLLYDNAVQPKVLHGLTPRAGAQVLITTRSRSIAPCSASFEEALRAQACVEFHYRKLKEGAKRSWRPGSLDQHAAGMAASLPGDAAMMSRPRSRLPDAWVKTKIADQLFRSLEPASVADRGHDCQRDDHVCREISDHGKSCGEDRA